MKPKKIVDFHVHAFADKIAVKAAANLTNYYHMPLVGDGKFDTILKRAKDAGVDKMVIHAVATKAEQTTVINNYVHEVLKSYPDHIIAFATIHRDFDDYKAELKRIKELGLCGIKLHSVFQNFNIDDDKMMFIYEEIVKNDLPILFHMGDRTVDLASPKRLARVLDKFPEMRAVAAHMGGVFSWEESMEYLVGRNVYFDTSSTLFELEDSMFLKMLHAHGTNKVMFGTDYPLSDYEHEFDRFARLNLTQEETDKIFYKNAYCFLRLKSE
mgnify:FL=1